MLFDKIMYLYEQNENGDFDAMIPTLVELLEQSGYENDFISNQEVVEDIENKIKTGRITEVSGIYDIIYDLGREDCEYYLYTQGYPEKIDDLKCYIDDVYSCLYDDMVAELNDNFYDFIEGNSIEYLNKNDNELSKDFFNYLSDYISGNLYSDEKRMLEITQSLKEDYCKNNDIDLNNNRTL